MPTGAKRILVVEDERLIARELQLRLMDLGHDVPVTVATADEALRSMSERCPDLVLMDIRLHGDSDGIDAAQVLRQRYDVPVVYLTAHSDPATLDRAKATDPAGYLLKPLKPGELRSAVEIALAKHAMTRQLRAREKWFATTLRSIGDAVISTDASGAVTYLNPVAEDLTGWRSDEASGHPLTDVLELVDERTRARVEHPVQRALDTGSVVRVPGPVLPGASAGVTLAESASPIVDDDGQVIGGVIVLRDMSEQHKLQHELDLSDRLASLGTLATGVAHEINNPLATVIANVESAVETLASRRAELGEPAWLAEVAEALRDAVSAAARIQTIVAELTLFAQPTTDRHLHASVEHVVQQALAALPPARLADVRITVACEPGLEVAVDARRVVQLVGHLLSNALAALAELPERAVAVRARTVGDQAVLEVSDTGVGMTPAIRARVFEPFFTTQPPGQGRGLGLAICHGIARAFGGAIAVESEPGQGSTFRVTLPLAAARASSPALATTPTQRGRVLVIDDEAPLRASLVRLLSKDHEVTAAATARSALAMIAAGQRFDLILCDLMMPDLTGMDVYEQLAATAPALAERVVFLTGGAFSARSTEFLAQTKQPVFEKPFSPNALRAALSARLAALGLLV